jgi:hypothetical protein
LFVINFTCVFICIDVNSLACPQNIPLTVPNLGEEQGEEVGGETVEEVVETDQQIFFEMDLDEGNDAHLTSIIYWCSLFCYHSVAGISLIPRWHYDDPRFPLLDVTTGDNPFFFPPPSLFGSLWF